MKCVTVKGNSEGQPKIGHRVKTILAKIEDVVSTVFQKKKNNGENGHICIIQSPFISEITLHDKSDISLIRLVNLQ